MIGLLLVATMTTTPTDMDKMLHKVDMIQYRADHAAYKQRQGTAIVCIITGIGGLVVGGMFLGSDSSIEVVKRQHQSSGVLLLGLGAMNLALGTIILGVIEEPQKPALSLGFGTIYGRF